MRRRLPTLLLTFAPCFALGACAATDSYQNVPMPAEESAAPAADACRVCVTRSSQVWGKVRRVEVVDNGVVVGSIGPSGYLCWERPPGASPIELFYHGPWLDGGAIEGVLPFEGEPGGTYVWAVHLREGDRKPEAFQLDLEEGMSLLEEREPAEAR